MVGPTAIIRGVTMTFGMAVIESEGATGYYDSNLDGKMTAMAAGIKDYDFGFVHVKGVDDAGHDKSFDIKCE
jgi:2,3-bisphosphoglycerate-independent phosphoglycerate mutase